MNKHSKLHLSKVSIPGTDINQLCYAFTQVIEENEKEPVSVFGIFHVLSGDEVYHTTIGLAVKCIIDFYTSTASKKQYTQEVGSRANEILFENALQYTNEQVSASVKDLEATGQTGLFDHKLLHFVVGAVAGSDLFLTFKGSLVKSFLFYPVIKDGIFSHYSSLAINDDSSSSTEYDGYKLFKSVVAGSLTHTGSTLVLANQPFLDYISETQLKQVVTTNPAHQLDDYFSKTLIRANAKADFNAVFASVIPSNSPQYQGAQPQAASDHSMDELVDREETTEHVLSPALGSKAKNAFAQMKKIPFHKPFFAIRDAVKRIPWSKIGSVIAGALNRFVRWIKVLYKRVALFVAGKFDASRPALQEMAKKNKKALVEDGIRTTKKAAHNTVAKAQDLIKNRGNLVEHIKGMSTLSKSLLGLSVIFIFLFAASIITLNTTRESNKLKKAYDSQVSTVEQRANQAEASLIYENEQKSTELLNEAQALLEKLPAATDEQKKKKADIGNKIISILDRINKVARIATPKVLTALDSKIPTLDGLKFIASGDTFLLYNNDSIYRLNPGTGEIKQINTQNKITSITCAAEYDASTFYFCGGDNKIFVLELKDETIKQASITLPKDTSKPRAIAFYGTRFYLIDDLDGKVYRYARSKVDALGKGSLWLTDTKANFTNAQSFVIDGSLYVLKDGTLTKLVSGGKTAQFSVPSVQPAITSLSGIYTDPDSAYFYFVDSSQKRITVLDKKTNKVKAQYFADAFADIRSFRPYESKKIILVAAGNNLYSIPLEFPK